MRLRWAVTGCACLLLTACSPSRYAAVGICALSTENASFVLNRVGGLGTEGEDVAVFAVKAVQTAVTGTLVADLVTDAASACTEWSYDGALGQYESGRTATFQVRDCSSGELIEQLTATLQNSATGNPPIPDQWHATITYDGKRKLRSTAMVGIAGSGALDFRTFTIPFTVVRPKIYTLTLTDAAALVLTDATGSGTSTFSNAKFEFEDGIKTGGVISTRVPMKWDRQSFVFTDDLSGAALTYSMTYQDPGPGSGFADQQQGSFQLSDTEGTKFSGTCSQCGYYPTENRITLQVDLAPTDGTFELNETTSLAAIFQANTRPESDAQCGDPGWI